MMSVDQLQDLTETAARGDGIFSTIDQMDTDCASTRIDASARMDISGDDPYLYDIYMYIYIYI